MIKELLKKSYALRCISYAITDWRNGRRGTVSEEHGITHSSLRVEESIAYIEDVFRDYKHYGEISQFHGRVAEVGPGDNCGVALLCLADGCESADLADRFYSTRNQQAQAAIYAALCDRYPEISLRLEQADLSDEQTFPGVVRHYGPTAAAEVFFSAPQSYEFIISRAVFEHLYDPILALQKMRLALKPGGMMIHGVDLRHHGLFAGDFHELKFLEVPGRLYRFMNAHSGRPNRVLVDRYRDFCVKAGIEHRILVTSLAGVGAVRPHVPYHQVPMEQRNRSLEFVRSVQGNLARPFRDMSPEDLSVSGFFIVAKAGVS